jgi:hypothetical protein
MTTEGFNDLNLKANQEVEITFCDNRKIKAKILDAMVKKGYDTVERITDDYINITNIENSSFQEVELKKIAKIDPIRYQ